MLTHKLMQSTMQTDAHPDLECAHISAALHSLCKRVKLRQHRPRDQHQLWWVGPSGLAWEPKHAIGVYAGACKLSRLYDNAICGEWYNVDMWLGPQSQHCCCRSCGSVLLFIACGHRACFEVSSASWCTEHAPRAGDCGAAMAC